jgi:hypothetical protein
MFSPTCCPTILDPGPGVRRRYGSGGRVSVRGWLWNRSAPRTVIGVGLCLPAPVAMPRSVVQAAPARVVGDARRYPAHGAGATAVMGRIGADPFTVPPEPPCLDRRVDAGAGDHAPELADRVQAHHFGRRPGESPSPGQHNPPRQLPLAHAGLRPDRNRASRRPNARWRRRTAPARARRDNGSESDARSRVDRLPAFRRLPSSHEPSTPARYPTVRAHDGSRLSGHRHDRKLDPAVVSRRVDHVSGAVKGEVFVW